MTRYSVFAERPWRRAIAHPLPVDRVTGDGFIDYAGTVAQDSRDQREIDLRHRPGGKLAGKIAMGRVVFRHYERPAGFLVQPMDDPGTFLPPDAGKILAMREESVDERVLRMPRARMHDDSGRLVQDEQIVVLENDVEADLFRLRFDLLDLRFAHFHDVTGADEIARARRLPVEDSQIPPGSGSGGAPGKSWGGPGRENGPTVAAPVRLEP